LKIRSAWPIPMATTTSPGRNVPSKLMPRTGAKWGGGRWERTDEWGNTWARLDPTSKGEVIQGVLQEISDMDAYEFPDYSRLEDYAGTAKLRAEQPDKWLVGGMPGFTFNIARKMRKLDRYLMDIFLEPERMRELHDRIDALLEHMIRNYAAQGADCVMFPEDWGTQTQTMISPDMWRQEFYPRFVKLCGIAHELKLKVFMHSCGMIAAIVPGLIEAGIDLLQFDQPDLHGIDKLAAYQEKSKITFWCPIDIQKTLQKRDEKIIRRQSPRDAGQAVERPRRFCRRLLLGQQGHRSGSCVAAICLRRV